MSENREEILADFQVISAINLFIFAYPKLKSFLKRLFPENKVQ